MTPTQPAAPAEQPHQRFGRIIRDARSQRGWTQEKLAENADVSTPTVQRYEYGKTQTPDPEAARRIFLALDLDPRIIPVVLGYVTAEEMGLPPEFVRQLDPQIEQVIAILEDPKIPAAAKAEWVEFLKFRAHVSSAAEGRGTAYNPTVAVEPVEGNDKAS